MTKEEIKNKIISADTIIQIAELLENEKLHYQKLGLYDKKFNYYNKNEVNIYRVTQDIVRYDVRLKSGENIEKEDIEWLKSQLTDRFLPAIDSIHISFNMFLRSERTNNTDVNIGNKLKTLNVELYLYENEVRYSVDTTELEEEAYKLHSDIANIFNSCPNRYNKTIKRRFIRSQCLSLTIGFIIAYIAMLLLNIKYDELPDVIHKVVESTKYSYVIIFFIIAFGIGNIIGQGITAALYSGIAPKKKYSHYDRSSRKNVYVDNITEFIEHNEVQIGKYYNSAAKRARIEKIFKVTGIIVALQIFAAIIYCLIIRIQ